MKRGNFLSDVLASPLETLKARFLAFCALEHYPGLCGAPILGGPVPAGEPVQPLRSEPVGSQPARYPRSLTARQREVVRLLAEGKSIKEAVGLLKQRSPQSFFAYCSLPRGHKGPHRA
jgi:hypothetical protein